MPKPDYSPDQTRPNTPDAMITIQEFTADPRVTLGLQPIASHFLKPNSVRSDTYGQQISGVFDTRTTFIRINTRNLATAYYDIGVSPACTNASTSISGETNTYVAVTKGGGHRVGCQAAPL